MPANTRTRITRTHEQTINTSLGELLQNLGRTWTIRSEDIGGIFEGGGRPDILIEKSDGCMARQLGWPVNDTSRWPVGLVGGRV